MRVHKTAKGLQKRDKMRLKLDLFVCMRGVGERGGRERKKDRERGRERERE